MANYEVIPIDELKQVRFYTSTDPGSYIAPHWHDAVEIIYMEEGFLDVSDDTGETRLPAGGLILINANYIHSTKCTAWNRAIVFQIPLSLLGRYIPDINSLRFRINSQRITSEKDRAKIRQFIEKLETMQYINDEKPEAGELLFQGLLFEVLYQLYHDFGSRLYKNKVRMHEKEMAKLMPLLQYVAAHYEERITIEEAAGILSYEPRYFCRFFKKATGMTFLEYLNELRLAYLYRDLLNTEEELQVLLSRHGFYNYKVFRRIFYDHFHMTPMEARKQYAGSL